MKRTFITNLTVSVVTIAALLALVAPVKDNSNKGGDDYNYGISTYADDEELFDFIKSE
ncbi:MAG: hypothetical protein ACI4R6_00110 [Lachnospiraceae bacterium]